MIDLGDDIRSIATVTVISTLAQVMEQVPGGRLNKKDGFTRYGNSHVKD